MVKKLLKISLLIFILFFCISSAFAYWFFCTDGKTKTCREFCLQLNNKLINIRESLTENKTVEVVLDNTIKADTCVICQSYMPPSDDLVFELQKMGIKQKLAQKINSDDRFVEGSYFYFCKGDKIICRSWLSYIDSNKWVGSRSFSDKIKFLVQFDPRSEKAYAADTTLDQRGRNVVIELAE